MTAPKWTPGPWMMTDAGSFVNDAGTPVVGVEHRTRKLNEREAANLALIAASPDLYAALDSIAQFAATADWGDPSQRCVEVSKQLLLKADAALARARGDGS